MGNTRNIQPKSVLTSNGSKTATLFTLTNFYDYHFDNGSGKATFKLMGMESPGTTTDGNGNTITLPESAVEYLIGDVDIPSAIVQQWGASDDIVFAYVASVLGVTII